MPLSQKRSLRGRQNRDRLLNTTQFSRNRAMSDADSTVPAGFRVIPGYPRYAINESGTVLSACKRGTTTPCWADAKRIKPMISKRGYHIVTLRHDGHQRQVFVHKLVLTTFVGPCPHGMMCRHLDGCKTNNYIGNLAWGTAKQNSNDMALHGTLRKGEKCNLAKLTESDVLEIRRRAANGERQLDITKDFPVTIHSISIIVRRKAWTHI